MLRSHDNSTVGWPKRQFQQTMGPRRASSQTRSRKIAANKKQPNLETGVCCSLTLSPPLMANFYNLVILIWANKIFSTTFTLAALRQGKNKNNILVLAFSSTMASKWENKNMNWTIPFQESFPHWQVSYFRRLSLVLNEDLLRVWLNEFNLHFRWGCSTFLVLNEGLLGDDKRLWRQKVQDQLVSLFFQPQGDFRISGSFKLILRRSHQPLKESKNHLITGISVHAVLMKIETLASWHQKIGITS